MTPTPEQWEQRFDEAKRNFELYGPLGMGIAYPKLKEFISQELQLQASQLLSEVEAKKAMSFAIYGNMPAPYDETYKTGYNEAIDQVLSLLRSKWEKAE